MIVIGDGFESGGKLWKVKKSFKVKTPSKPCGSVRFQIISVSCSNCGKTIGEDVGGGGCGVIAWSCECPHCKKWTSFGGFYQKGRLEHPAVIQCRTIRTPKKKGRR